MLDVVAVSLIQNTFETLDVPPVGISRLFPPRVWLLNDITPLAKDKLLRLRVLLIFVTLLNVFIPVNVPVDELDTVPVMVILPFKVAPLRVAPLIVAPLPLILPDITPPVKVLVVIVILEIVPCAIVPPVLFIFPVLLMVPVKLIVPGIVFIPVNEPLFIIGDERLPLIIVGVEKLPLVTIGFEKFPLWIVAVVAVIVPANILVPIILGLLYVPPFNVVLVSVADPVIVGDDIIDEIYVPFITFPPIFISFVI